MAQPWSSRSAAIRVQPSAAMRVAIGVASDDSARARLGFLAIAGDNMGALLPFISHRPHLGEPCAARRLEGWPRTLRPAYVLRDARESARLRTRSVEKGASQIGATTDTR